MHITSSSFTRNITIRSSTIMQVILVGHDFGGACISYAMEMFPSKVAKAVFLCAAMLTNGHSALGMFQQQVDFLLQQLILLNDNINKIKQTNTECCLFSLIQITLSFYDYVLIPFFRSRWTQMALSKRHRNSYTPTARTGLQPPSTSTRHC